jgi:hypothetical protein
MKLRVLPSHSIVPWLFSNHTKSTLNNWSWKSIHSKCREKFISPFNSLSKCKSRHNDHGSQITKWEMWFLFDEISSPRKFSSFSSFALHNQQCVDKWLFQRKINKHGAVNWDQLISIFHFNWMRLFWLLFISILPDCEWIGTAGSRLQNCQLA